MEDLLGGALGPIGWTVHFLDAPVDVVEERLLQLRHGFGDVLEVVRGVPAPDALAGLPPFEAPWSREVVLARGAWTVYLNNGLLGGDSTALGPALGRSLGVRCVVARHTPWWGPGHRSTQVEVHGPAGEPPLMLERTLSATATDGRWGWHASGEPFAFEDTGSYAARRVADRLDRPLLLRYLRHLGIPVDDGPDTGPATVVQQRTASHRRAVPLEEARSWISG